MPQIPDDVFKRKNALIHNAKKEVAELVKELRALEDSRGESVEKKEFDSLLNQIEDEVGGLEDFGDDRKRP